MQQGPGAEVVVEQSRRAAELGEPQPRPQEHGLIAQEKRYRVALSDTSVFPQHSGDPVTLPVSFPIRKSRIFVRDESFVWLLAR